MELAVSNKDLVACDKCNHFMPDQVGDGSGIGQCDLRIGWTKSPRGKIPLFRYAKRFCSKFTRPEGQAGDIKGEHVEFVSPKKSELTTLIRMVSVQHGGDDPQFLDEYIQEVIKEWEHDLDTALACFRDLVKQNP